jgi:hypothetical protein
VNIHGMSNASAEKSVTISADGNKVALSIDAQAGIEEFWVFRTEANGASGSEAFIGRVLADRNGGATTFVDAQAMLPGLDGIIFMPKKANRGKLAVLGNLLSKMKLGRLGLSEETIYVSYLAHILEYPRHYGLVSNVFQELNL